MLILTIIPILALLGYSLQFSKLVKVQWIFALPAVTSIIIITLYLTAILKILPQATWLLYVLGIIILMYYLVTDESVKLFDFKNYHKEIAIFSILCVVCGLYLHDKNFHAWDDLSHWAIFSSELLERNFFEYQNIPSSIIETHAHYPRGSAVYHYFFLFLNGFTEGGALFAHFILHLIFLSPLLQNRKIWQSLALILVMLMVISLYTTGIRSIYNDSTVGIMFGAILAINILESDKSEALLLALPILILLPLFREIGLIFAVFATIILSANYIRDNKINNIALAEWSKLLLMFSLPILASYLLMNYFKNTHDFFPRIEHSFNNLIDLSKKFNASHKLLLLNYFKFWLLFLIKEGSLIIYILIGTSWYLVNKYKNDLKSEYKFFMIGLGLFFIIFSLWRLYLYFFTFSYYEAIRAASMLRYLGSYCISFAFISCAFIKKSYFRKDLDNFLSKGWHSFLTIALIITVPLIQVVHTILRLKPLPQYLKERNIQLAIVKQFMMAGYFVKFDFENKPFDNLSCYRINYKLAPYLKYNVLNDCLATTPLIEDNIKKLENFTDIYDIKTMSKSDYEILYSPFLNKLEIIRFK